MQPLINEQPLWNMTKRTIQKLLDRRVNVYLSAEEAVEYGIADEIIN